MICGIPNYSLVNCSAAGSAGPGASGGGGPYQGLQEETEAETVLPLQRPPRVRQHHHQQKKVNEKTVHIKSQLAVQISTQNKLFMEPVPVLLTETFS